MYNITGRIFGENEDDSAEFNDSSEPMWGRYKLSSESPGSLTILQQKWILRYRKTV